jgi:tRNA(Ile)-lysidine synthase
MLEKFKFFITEQNLCRSSESILLAVSGGIDSMILLDLFQSAGFNIIIAHCNFRLRGEESDGDEKFVRECAGERGLKCFVQAFNTMERAEEEGISIQMAARDLRYEWFERIRIQNQYDLIATAHNQDDVLETFFVNLSRGTGIRGLSGIPVKSGKIIRPLLFASRDDITTYAGMKHLDYREDSSNLSDKYLRNKIRHQLIPMMEEKNPSFRQSMAETIAILKDTGIVYKSAIDRMKNVVMQSEKEKFLIKLADLKRVQPLRPLLFEILSEFNFNSQIMDDVLHSLDSPPGKQFFSSSHRLVKDREHLIITKLEESDQRKYYIELNQEKITNPIHLDWIVVDNSKFYNIPEDPGIASLDLDMLEFPLILRRWQQGDYFQPFGMKGMKKLSDYLIDMKVPLPDKEKVWLLTTGSKIVWVVGFRIDENFRIRPDTNQILVVRYKE